MDNLARLLVIDDDKALLMGLAETIRREGKYHVITADNGTLGIQLAQENPPHLIICDVTMPAPDGWAVLKSLSMNPVTATIPFIFLTAKTEDQDKVNGIELGADDFVTKPFNKNELLARIRAILRRKDITETQERDKSEEQIRSLREKIQELITNSSTDQEVLAEALSQMLFLRDNETEEHARRVADLSDRLARKLGVKDFPLNHVRLGALLHDVGKVGIPDAILLKTGPLTDKERKLMGTHVALGEKILKPLGLPPAALDLVYHHHERWDGNGYPDGLAGENIPLPARIFAIVDVWDALSHDRPYRKAWPTDKVTAYLSEQAGKHFDPFILEEFLYLIKCDSKGG